jgi:hypothetical protein
MDPSSSPDTPSLWAAIIATLGGLTAAVVKLIKNGRDISQLRQRVHALADAGQGTIARVRVLEAQHVEIQRRLDEIRDDQVRAESKLDRILERVLDRP